MSEGIIDLRSDTVTKPSPGMRDAMYRAEVDDDALEHDPTTLRLEEKSAELLGKEAALYVPSGTMANQICIKIYTKPGQQILCSETGHVARCEVCMASAFSGVQPERVASPNGYFTAAETAKHIYPDEHWLPETGLISVENTMNGPGGTVFPQHEIESIAGLCREKQIPLHMDGARLFNAAVASGRPAAEIVRNVDAVSFCLSKGLGAPVGSMVVGSKDFIHEARRIRQMMGGGMRQSGVIAAAGLYALENNIERLAEDHENAQYLARGLAEIPGVSLAIETVETNMVYIDLTDTGTPIPEFAAAMEERGVRLLHYGQPFLRFVIHLDISRDDVERALVVAREALGSA